MQDIQPGHVVYLEGSRLRQDMAARGEVPNDSRPYLVVGALLERVWLHPITTNPPKRLPYILLHRADWEAGYADSLGKSSVVLWTVLKMTRSEVRHASERQEFFTGERPRINSTALECIREKIKSLERA